MPTGDPLFTISLYDARQVVSSNRSRYFEQLLNERLPQFRAVLREELSLVAADAIEIAYLRTVPEATEHAAEFYACDTCGGLGHCQCIHDFIAMDHCLMCLDRWNQNHSPEDCFASPHADVCARHSGHPADACQSQCIKHKVTE